MNSNYEDRFCTMIQEDTRNIKEIVKDILRLYEYLAKVTIELLDEIERKRVEKNDNRTEL